MRFEDFLIEGLRDPEDQKIADKHNKIVHHLSNKLSGHRMFLDKSETRYDHVANGGRATADAKKQIHTHLTSEGFSHTVKSGYDSYKNGKHEVRVGHINGDHHSVSVHSQKTPSHDHLD